LVAFSWGQLSIEAPLFIFVFRNRLAGLTPSLVLIPSSDAVGLESTWFFVYAVQAMGFLPDLHQSHIRTDPHQDRRARPAPAQNEYGAKYKPVIKDMFISNPSGKASFQLLYMT
jgi:hypothetical protein